MLPSSSTFKGVLVNGSVTGYQFSIFLGFKDGTPSKRSRFRITSQLSTFCHQKTTKQYIRFQVQYFLPCIHMETSDAGTSTKPASVFERFWEWKNTTSLKFKQKTPQRRPPTIGSMGRTAYLPRWMIDVYGTCIAKYTRWAPARYKWSCGAPINGLIINR